MSTAFDHAEPIRCFLGFSVHGPWPDWQFPHMLRPEDRHLTMLFLGQQAPQTILQHADHLQVPCPVAPLLLPQQWLLLPKRHPHVLALDVEPITHKAALIGWEQELRTTWPAPEQPSKDAKLSDNTGRKPWLPHVSITRDPSEALPELPDLPLWCGDFHLYQSLPGRIYRAILTWPVPRAFEEIEHPADRAFVCRGLDWEQLSMALLWALAQEVPSLIHGVGRCRGIQNQQQAVWCLNQILGEADARASIPWKAVTFHGRVEQKTTCIEWEVIVDV